MGVNVFGESSCIVDINRDPDVRHRAATHYPFRRRFTHSGEEMERIITLLVYKK